jgi:hypothetical protein
MSRSDPLAARLDRLGSFVAVFEAPGFVAGEYVTPDSAPGVWMMSYARYHPEVDRFVSLAYEDGWIRTGFNWGEWSATPEARTLRVAPEGLASATPDQLARLITVLVRQERFSEGSLKGAFEGGLVLAIVRRAGVLAGHADG